MNFQLYQLIPKLLIWTQVWNMHLEMKPWMPLAFCGHRRGHCGRSLMINESDTWHPFVCFNIIKIILRPIIYIEKVIMVFCHQNCSHLLWENISNSRPSASNFKSFSRSIKQFIQAVKVKTIFGNKILF